MISPAATKPERPQHSQQPEPPPPVVVLAARASRFARRAYSSLSSLFDALAYWTSFCCWATARVVNNCAAASRPSAQKRSRFITASSVKTGNLGWSPSACCDSSAARRGRNDHICGLGAANCRRRVKDCALHRMCGGLGGALPQETQAGGQETWPPAFCHFIRDQQSLTT